MRSHQISIQDSLFCLVMVTSRCLGKHGNWTRHNSFGIPVTASSNLWFRDLYLLLFPSFCLPLQSPAAGISLPRVKSTSISSLPQQDPWFWEIMNTFSFLILFTLLTALDICHIPPFHESWKIQGCFVFLSHGLLLNTFLLFSILCLAS